MDTEQIGQILHLEADSVTERPIRIPFSVADKTHLPEGKEVKEIVITPLKVRTWFRIKPLLLKIEKEDLNKITSNEQRAFDSEAPEIFSKYDKLLIDIICIGIHNKNTDQPSWFKDVLIDNCQWQDLHILLNAILFRLGTNPFYRSITQLQRVSPISEAEIIALQKNAASWTKTPQQAVSQP